MARPKTLEDGVRVSTGISREQLERIQHMARKMLVAENRSITASEAVEAVSPTPKSTQMDMFLS